MVVLHSIHELYLNDPKKAAWNRHCKGGDANLLRWFRLTQIRFLLIWSLHEKKESYWRIFIWFVCKILTPPPPPPKKKRNSYPLLHNISYLLLQNGMCTYHGVRNVGFSEKVSDVLNECTKVSKTRNLLKKTLLIH